MVSKFEDILRKAKQEGQRKLKIIAPKFPTPESSGGKISSDRRRSGGGMSAASIRAQAEFKARLEREAASKVKAQALAKAQAISKAQASERAKALVRTQAIKRALVKARESKPGDIIRGQPRRRLGDVIRGQPKRKKRKPGDIQPRRRLGDVIRGQPKRKKLKLGDIIRGPRDEGVLTPPSTGGRSPSESIGESRRRLGDVIRGQPKRKKLKPGDIIRGPRDVFSPTGTKINEDIKRGDMQPASKGFFRDIASAFSPKKARDRRERQNQAYYDIYGLEGSARNQRSLNQAARTTNLNKTQQQQFDKVVIRDFKSDVLSKDNRIRAEAAMVIAAVAGGPLIGGAVGTIYKTPITLAEDAGDAENFKDVSWKQVAKTSGFELGKNALQAYIALKVFGLASRGAMKIPALTKSVLTRLGLRKSGILTNKGLRFGLKSGLNIASAEYISSVGTEGALAGKRFREGEFKAATIKSSALAGSLVGFYGNKAVKGALRKVLLKEDPRLILTAGTKTKPFAIEARDITVARLNRAKALLKKNQKLKVKFAKASPVKEPRRKKIVTPEKRVARGVRIDVPTPSGYATYEVGKEIYIIPKTFLKLRIGNTPKSYYTKWISNVRKKGLLPTFKELGLPKLHSPTIYKGSGDYLSRKRGESLKKYYARAQRVANKNNVVQVVVAPKTILKAKQPELEIKTIYPNPKGVKASVSRVKVGKDAFGHNVYVEIVAPKSITQRVKFSIKEKIKFKKGALRHLTNKDAKIAKALSKRITQNYNFIYKSKIKGAKSAKAHMLKVENNFRRILNENKIKVTEAEIKAASRLHDILKLRGLNVKDESIIKKAIMEGYLNNIPAIRKLTTKQKIRVAKTIGFHQDTNPRTLKSLKLDTFAKAFINADRLDITRYGVKVDKNRLFNLKAKSLIPKNIRTEFGKLLKLKNSKRGFLLAASKRYNALLKKYPGLQGKTIEDKIIKENKKRYKNLSPAEKKNIKIQERGYKDHREALSEYNKLKKGGKIKSIPYQTKKYKSYKNSINKAAYRAGYEHANRDRNSAPTNYKTNYGKNQPAYKEGYKERYKNNNYQVDFKTGKYKYIGKREPQKKPLRKSRGFIGVGASIIKRTKKIKPQQVFNVFGKSKGKFVRLNIKPLTRADALSKGTFAVDRTTARTFKISPAGKSKTPGLLLKGERNYFNRQGFKLREVRIKKGRKFALKNKYIEKIGHAIDTKSEKAGLSLAKHIKQQQRPKRKITPTQRKILIKRLEKARAVKRNLKGGRKK